MKSKQATMIELNGKMVNHSKICYKLRECKDKENNPITTEKGERILSASDAFYARDKTGALKLLYNTKPGKAAKRAAKRERVKERKLERQSA